ncbi:type II secretion system protein GspJ [Planctomicrobium piriforme]|uniref:Type II secretion system protein J n=1 Tax=Planctomicrobium piriforme TaxID=1576369 RepID=A0A1I3IJT2_9PLAN|nr:type II secretion system protein GspJ [Planctomicrobium piriforme]SFI48248.1 prepilin-type N-terminal cleavage/methylation domain-containing protein [Planctomicrobium piriforme]
MKRGNSTHAGFSLLEVLIALGLSVLLVSSVYAAIDLYYRYNLAGRAEVAGQQLMRGLTRRMSDDIGSVVMTLPQAETTTSDQQAADESSSGSSSSGQGSGSSSGSASNGGGGGASAFGGSTGSTSSSSSSTSSSGGAAAFDNNSEAASATTGVSFAGLEESGPPKLFGLVGTAELLHLSVSQPSRDLSYATVGGESTAEGRSSDLQVITYGLATIDSIMLALMQKDLDAVRPEKGLGRRSRDLFALDSVDETLSGVDLLAPEVTEMSFRYFDGTSWADAWDSQSVGLLPRAVEVTYGVWNPPRRQVGRVDRTQAGTVSRFVHVFHLPLSEPAVTETAP